MLVVIEILLVMFLWSIQCMPILMWVISLILFQMSFETGNERIYLEIIDSYPVEDCVKPQRFKFIYKSLNKLSNKGIPKEMYFCETMKICGFIIYSILALCAFFIDDYFASLFGIINIGFYCVLSLLCAFILKKKSFIEKYKMLNKHNIKYLFLPNNEPLPQLVGSCQIMAETKKNKRTFVTVKMLGNGEIKERVLLLNKNKQEADFVYSIYVICEVFYIIQKTGDGSLSSDEKD